MAKLTLFGFLAGEAGAITLMTVSVAMMVITLSLFIRLLSILAEKPRPSGGGCKAILIGSKLLHRSV